MTFWCGSDSGSQDPYLWKMDPDPTPDPTPFFIDFRMHIFHISYFFLITCPQAHHLQSRKSNFLLKFCVKIYFEAIISVRSAHLWEKKDPDPYLRLMDLDPVWKAQKYADPADPDPDPDPQHWLKPGITYLQHGLIKRRNLDDQQNNIR